MQKTHERFPCFHIWVNLETRNIGQCRMMQNKKGILLKERGENWSLVWIVIRAKLRSCSLHCQKSTCVKIKKNKTVKKMLAPIESRLRDSCIGERKHHTRHKAATSCFPKLVKVETESIGNDINKRKRTRKKYKKTMREVIPLLTKWHVMRETMLFQSHLGEKKQSSTQLKKNSAFETVKKMVWAPTSK